VADSRRASGFGLERGKVFPAAHARSLLNPLRKLVQSPERTVAAIRIGPADRVLELGCGPGYFTMLPAPGRAKELVVDYTKLPTSKPDSWPAIAPNDKGTHTLVYGYLNDFCRRVSDGVFIGSAERKGKYLDIYFTVAIIFLSGKLL